MINVYDHVRTFAVALQWPANDKAIHGGGLDKKKKDGQKGGKHSQKQNPPEKSGACDKRGKTELRNDDPWESWGLWHEIMWNEVKWHVEM